MSRVGVQSSVASSSPLNQAPETETSVSGFILQAWPDSWFSDFLFRRGTDASQVYLWETGCPTTAGRWMFHEGRLMGVCICRILLCLEHPFDTPRRVPQLRLLDVSKGAKLLEEVLIVGVVEGTSAAPL